MCNFIRKHAIDFLNETNGLPLARLVSAASRVDSETYGCCGPEQIATVIIEAAVERKIIGQDKAAEFKSELIQELTLPTSDGDLSEAA